MNTPPRLDARILFGTPKVHPGLCCDCCSGFCPEAEGLSAEERDRVWWRSTFTLTVDGVEYLSDRYTLIRADTLTHLPGDDEDATPLPVSDAMRDQLVAKLCVPPSEPPKSVDPVQSLAQWDRVVRAGLTQRACDSDLVVLLYVGDEHVGWATKAKKGIRRAEYDRIAAAADRAAVQLTTAKAVIDALEVAS